VEASDSSLSWILEAGESYCCWGSSWLEAPGSWGRDEVKQGKALDHKTPRRDRGEQRYHTLQVCQYGNFKVDVTVNGRILNELTSPILFPFSLLPLPRLGVSVCGITQAGSTKCGSSYVS
jgi:hypothetical protein